MVSILINRKEEIKKKGFSMSLDSDTAQFSPYQSVDFSKIKVGIKTLEDATYNIGSFKKIDRRFGDKEYVLKAIHECRFSELREISDFFYKTSGIYSRLCRYMAYMYRYDWVVMPMINTITKDELKSDKVLDNFYKALTYLDNFEVKKFFGEIALKVIRYGAFYGYLIPQADRMQIQELPSQYCRTRFTTQSGRPVVEFNMRFFVDCFGSEIQRQKIIDIFPKEFKKGYDLYRKGQLPPDFPGDDGGWYMLDPENTIKFNVNGEDFPMFISTIPAIIDLDEAQGLDKKKLEQQLLKIIIQKMPIDKNGDLVFDVDEAQALHNNAVNMLSRAIGIDVLTTFADVEVADMADSTGSTTAADDTMTRVKQAIFDESGVSQQQFNSENSVALEKSILNDEATIYNLIQQFESFLNLLLKPFNKAAMKKASLRAQILPTTIYNYKELAKLYKEQTQLGYSKMLPQIALGQSESAILSAAYFENEMLDLVNIFIPPLMSSTMNADILNKNGSSSSDDVGRPTNEEAGKPTSEKTAQNRESQGAG